MINNLLEYIKGHKYILTLPVYAVIYLIFFGLIEALVTDNYYVLHSPIDDLIPFNEFFVVFYYLWFPYVIVTAVISMFGDKEEHLKMALYLMLGMTIFIVVSFIFPNGQDLRPDSFERANVFTGLVKRMYKIDTPTNVLPSIHVYNSIVCHVGVVKSEFFKDKPIVKWLSLFLCIMICLSTLFIKQHSVIDAFAGAIMALAFYFPVYKIKKK